MKELQILSREYTVLPLPKILLLMNMLSGS